MPITFRCPECGGLLSVPRKLQGQIINCSHNGCVVTVRGTATETAGGNGQHAAALVAGAGSGDPRTTGSGSARVSDPAGASTAGLLKRDSVAIPGDLRSSAGAGSAVAHPASGEAPIVIEPVDPRKTGSTSGPLAKRGDRLQRNVAKFVKADSAATGVQLAVDGRLPELSLTEGVDRRALGESKGLNPLVMIVVLCLSFLMSTVLLFVEIEPSQSTSSRHAVARRQLAEFYKEPRAKLQPYQQYLREAQQAHSRGDAETERRLYRRVLNLLHAEGRSRFVSLTGSPREDKELEELLSVLMSEE